MRRSAVVPGRSLVLATAATGLALLGAGCSLAPSGLTKPGTASPPATSIGLYLSWGNGKLTVPPATINCGPDGTNVVIRSPFGPDSVTLTLAGLHKGRNYTFVTGDQSLRASVALRVTGPQAPVTAYIGPQQGLVTGGVGSITVSKLGTSGTLNIEPSELNPISGSWNCSDRSSARSAPSPLPRLQPASVPPSVGECVQAIETSPDGNVSPLTCADGSVNIPAWDALTRDDISVLGLGPHATVANVRAALCQVRSQTPQDDSTQESAVQIAAAYYGWQLGASPTTVVTGNAC